MTHPESSERRAVMIVLAAAMVALFTLRIVGCHSSGVNRSGGLDDGMKLAGGPHDPIADAGGVDVNQIIQEAVRGGNLDAGGAVNLGAMWLTLTAKLAKERNDAIDEAERIRREHEQQMEARARRDAISAKSIDAIRLAGKTILGAGVLGLIGGAALSIFGFGVGKRLISPAILLCALGGATLIGLTMVLDVWDGGARKTVTIAVCLIVVGLAIAAGVAIVRAMLLVQSEKLLEDEEVRTAAALRIGANPLLCWFPWFRKRTLDKLAMENK